jgi:hypothetical protein
MSHIFVSINLEYLQTSNSNLNNYSLACIIFHSELMVNYNPCIDWKASGMFSCKRGVWDSGIA